MNFKRKIGISVIFLIALAASIYVTRTFTDPGTTVFYFSLSFALVLLPFFFFGNVGFETWRRFAIPYVILSGVLLLFGDYRGGSWGVGSIIDDREGVALILSALFFLLSLILIAVKWWKIRRESKNSNLSSTQTNN